MASAERAVPGGDEGYLRNPLTPDDLPEVTDEELRNQPEATGEPVSEPVCSPSTAALIHMTKCLCIFRNVAIARAPAMASIRSTSGRKPVLRYNDATA